MDAVAAAHHQFELQRQYFIYGDLKSEMLGAFRGAEEAFVYHEEGDEVTYMPIDVAPEQVFDDKMSSSFKVGDRFKCAIKENSKERWFQIMYGAKRFINLRDPQKFIKREVDGIDYFIFVDFRSISIVMVNKHQLGMAKVRSLIPKVSKSIIGYDKHGSTYLKRGVK